MNKIPSHYIPSSLSEEDQKKQLEYIVKSRQQYKKGKYFTRPKVMSFEPKESKYVKVAKKLYNLNSLKPTQELANKTGCELEGLKQIVNKGIGAYYSSGSRPNQTPFSWGLARLASALTGGKSAKIDYDILEKYCKANSLPLQMAT
jgi:hypothetical protein